MYLIEFRAYNKIMMCSELSSIPPPKLSISNYKNRNEMK